MIKNKTVLEITTNERVYQLILSPESPLGEVYDVLMQMRALVIEKIDDITKSTQQGVTNDSSPAKPTDCAERC